MTEITMRDADENGRSYGIVRESVTVHRFHGRGIHNRNFSHRLQVWDNRPAEGGGYLDPRGRATDSPRSLLWSAQAMVITAGERLERDPQGPALALGDVVTVDGERFTIEALPLHDPHCTPVDHDPTRR